MAALVTWSNAALFAPYMEESQSQTASVVLDLLSVETADAWSFLSCGERMARVRRGSLHLPFYEDHSPRAHPLHHDDRRSAPKLRHDRSMTLQTQYSWIWRTRTCRQAFKALLVVTVATLLIFWWFWELHVELTLYPRNWAHRGVMKVERSSGCFSRSRLSPKYNLTRALAPKRYEFQAGLPLRLGMDCYDFAATFQPLSAALDPSSGITNFHMYWRADPKTPFGERQEWTIKSFFATQDLWKSWLMLWSNGDLRTNEAVWKWMKRYPDVFYLKIVDLECLAKGTSLEGSELLHRKDRNAWVDADLIRLLVIWAYGGIWMDMETLLARDLSPLLEHEFVTQWDCYDKVYQPSNGALMHFLQHSPYLCEAFDIIARSPPPKAGSVEWDALLYLKLWRRAVAAGVGPFKILPFCFTDAQSCRGNDRLPGPFSKDESSWAGVLGFHEGGLLDQTLRKIFSVRLHSQRSKTFPRDGWVDRLLLKRYDNILGA